MCAESSSSPMTGLDGTVSTYDLILLSLKYSKQFLRDRQRIYLTFDYLCVREEYSSSLRLSSSTVGMSPTKSVSSPTEKAGVDEI